MNFADFGAMMQIKAQRSQWESINHLIESARRRKQQTRRCRKSLKFSTMRTGRFSSETECAVRLRLPDRPYRYRLDDYYEAFQEVERYFHMAAEDYVYVVAIAAPEGNAEGNERSWSNICTILSAAHRGCVTSSARVCEIWLKRRTNEPLERLGCLAWSSVDETIQSTHNLVLAAIQKLYAYGLNASQTGDLRAVVDASVTDPMEGLSIDWDNIYTALEIAQRNAKIIGCQHRKRLNGATCIQQVMPARLRST